MLWENGSTTELLTPVRQADSKAGRKKNERMKFEKKVKRRKKEIYVSKQQAK